MKLVFVRHGETDYNKVHRAQGQRIDTGLNEIGRRQAQETALLLTDDFEAIFTSPLKRAFETAQIINERFQKNLIKRNELMERDYGSLSGTTWEETEAITGKHDLRDRDLRQEYDYRSYGGESVEDVRARLMKFLDELKKENYQKVLVVSHGGITRLMHFLFFQKEIRELKNATIHEFEI